jgi:hypothetical protein
LILSIPRSGLEISDPLAGGLGGKRGGSMVVHIEKLGRHFGQLFDMRFQA